MQTILLKLRRSFCIHRPHESRVLQAVYFAGRNFNCEVRIDCSKCGEHLNSKFEWRESHRWEKYYGDDFEKLKLQWSNE
jgi:hypothetical protein